MENNFKLLNVEENDLDNRSVENVETGRDAHEVLDEGEFLGNLDDDSIDVPLCRNCRDLNGEESDGETEERVLSTVTDDQLNTLGFENHTLLPSASDEILTSTPERQFENPASDIEEKVQDFRDMSPILENATGFDNDVEGGYAEQEDVEGLSEVIEDAIQKHLDSDDSYTFCHKCDMPDSEQLNKNESKEVSVQTASEKLFVPNDSCPVCKQEKEGLNTLKALCLEYPPYKKRKILGFDGDNLNASDSGYEEIDDNVEENEGSELRRKTATSNNDITLKSESQCTIKGAESSSRSIRLGLSKKAKLRPLHPTAKSQATNSTQDADS